MPKPRWTGPGRELRTASAGSAVLPAPILLEGEDPKLYGRVLEQVREAVSPRDIIEEFWVHDIVALAWETSRLRRLKANLINKQALKQATERQSRATGGVYHAGIGGVSPEQLKDVERSLAEANLSWDDLITEAFSVRLTNIERLEALIERAEVRRSNIIREIDRHRAALASRLRDATEAIDAEFSELDPPTSEAREAEIGSREEI